MAAGGDTQGVDDLLANPTGDLGRWKWLWAGDHRFPVRSHRRFWGAFVVACKRLLRPLVEAPQRELWERQRLYNLALLAELERLRVDELWRTVYAVSSANDERAAAHEARLVAHEQAFSHHDDALAANQQRFATHERQFETVDGAFKGYDLRVGHLEKLMAEGLRDVMRHDDALFALLDQKLDRQRREARELTAQLQAALARSAEVAEPAAGREVVAALDQALSEARYVELERRYRGTEGEIGDRLAIYLPRLAGRREVLDLGCGRGEALRLLAAAGLAPRGVDSSTEMVAHCRAQGLTADVGDLFAYLAAQPAASLDAVVSFHVVEHLPADALGRLVSLAWRALRAGGLLILETPNPLSVVVAARNFWLDPTHRRPVHPESLRLACELAGFAEVETLFLRPFPASERLPEIDLAALPAEQQGLADGVNRLRDRLDETLFGHQDYAILARRA